MRLINEYTDKGPANEAMVITKSEAVESVFGKVNEAIKKHRKKPIAEGRDFWMEAARKYMNDEGIKNLYRAKNCLGMAIRIDVILIMDKYCE